MPGICLQEGAGGAHRHTQGDAAGLTRLLQGPVVRCSVCLPRVDRSGPNRRLPHEYSYQERQRRQRGEVQPVVEDVARIRGCYWTVVPGGPREGQVVPFLHVAWMRYCDPWPRMAVPDQERASLTRSKAILDQWGVEGVQKDTFEWPYMMQPDEVAGIQYLQHGYYGQGCGPPDFWWTDTMWDKLK